jgi:hypothetical protein
MQCLYSQRTLADGCLRTERWPSSYNATGQGSQESRSSQNPYIAREQTFRSLGQARAKYAVPLLATHIGQRLPTSWAMACSMNNATGQGSTESRSSQKPSRRGRGRWDGEDFGNNQAGGRAEGRRPEPPAREDGRGESGTTERVEQSIATTAMIQIHVHAPGAARAASSENRR